MNKLLGVNVDHIATLRQARKTIYPSPVEAALLAEQNGADIITVHLREDRRHIQDEDVFKIKDKIKCKLNFEMAATEEMVTIAKNILPYICCIVPEKRTELTTEGGLNIQNNINNLKNIIRELNSSGIKVSLFLDPEINMINLVPETGAQTVELHTGEYSNVNDPLQKNILLNKIKQAAKTLNQYNIQVNAGHGLHYENIQPLLSIRELREFHIGHSIISRACFVGIGNAVAEMKRIISDTRYRN